MLCFDIYPRVLQLQIEEIISSIHKGALRGSETYPYKIRRTLSEESETRIMLNLSNYQIPEAKAEELEKARMQFKASLIKVLKARFII